MDPTFYIQWHITNFCTLRCRHCYQDDFSKENDLDWQGLKRVFDNVDATLMNWGRKACVHLTGGEPLLKPELFPLLADLEQRPLVEEVGIISNGLPLNHEMIKRLSAFGKLKKIKISLDGVDAETHDSIRQVGTFDRVIQNLSLLQKGGRFEVIVMFTVMKRNFQNLVPFIRFCQDLDVDGLIIERFIPWGRGREVLGEVLDRHQWKDLVETLFEFFSIEMGEDKTAPYQAFQVDFQRGEPELLGAPCVLGEDGICIMPQGDVFPCRRFPFSIGNLVDAPLKSIWEKSEILAKLRKRENLKGRCRNCGWQECRGCRSLAFSLTGDFLAEDPHCWFGNGK